MPMPCSIGIVAVRRCCAVALLALAAAGPALAAGEVGEARAKEAAAALQRGQTEKATQLYTEALADTALANSRRAAIHNDRGVAFARLNQSRVAIDDFNKAASLSPETASIYNNRGNVLLAIGFAREAVKDFDRAILLAPGYSAAYANRANAFARLGENEAAIRDFSQAIQLTPQGAAALFGRGRLHLGQNRPHAALRDFTRAVTHDVRFAQGYRGRADAKLLLARFEEAIEDLSRAVAFEPNNVEIYLTRGYAYLASRNTASAIKDFQRAAEINARSSAAYEGLALAHAKAEAYDDALNNLAKALEFDPRSAQAYAYRAIIYKWMGQPDIGAKDLERAARLDANRPEVLWARAELTETQSNAADVVSDLRRAIAGRPWLRDAAASLDRLGASAADEVEVKELAFDRWRVYQQAGRYFAYHVEMPRLAVPLEMISDAAPRLLEWDIKSPAIRGVGILRFRAGQVDGKEGPEEVEQAAVIDIQSRAVVAVETIRQGKRQAKWTWEDAKVIVAGVDGHIEEYPIRGKGREIAQPAAQQQPPPQRRVTSSEPKYGPGGTPGWAPWGNSGGGGKGKSKSLFDLLFNN